MRTAVPSSDPKKGYAIGALGGLMLAVDIPLIRLAETDPWTTLVIRAPIMIFVFLLFTQIFKAWGIRTPKLYEGRDTLTFGTFHAVATLCFVFAIFNTTTANLVFITAFASLISLVLAFVFLGERHPNSTWVTVFCAFSGIMLITLDDFSTNGFENIFGNLAALVCAFMLAIEMLFARNSEKNLALAPAFSSILAALFALPFVLINGPVLGAPQYLLFNAVFIAPLAMSLLALAPRYITAPEATMFFLLETVLAPLFVWIIFLEQPTANTLLGGGIVVAAIVSQSLYQIRKQRRLRAL